MKHKFTDKKVILKKKKKVLSRAIKVNDYIMIKIINIVLSMN